jgi:hypothetical protein
MRAAASTRLLYSSAMYVALIDNMVGVRGTNFFVQLFCCLLFTAKADEILYRLRKAKSKKKCENSRQSLSPIQIFFTSVLHKALSTLQQPQASQGDILSSDVSLKFAPWRCQQSTEDFPWQVSVWDADRCSFMNGPPFLLLDPGFLAILHMRLWVCQVSLRCVDRKLPHCSIRFIFLSH